jgi:cystathionine beta-lyase
VPATAREAFEALSLDELRRRRSEKWRRYPEDVLPAWVAEMDFPLPPPVRAALLEAVERDDCGYANAGELPEVFARFAAERWDWRVDPARVHVVPDVMTGVAEVLRALTEPGAPVVVNPPVYPPFFNVTREIGRRVVEVPLAADRHLDLDGIERALAAGARAILLCNPHNPTGTVFTEDELAGVAALAARHGALVVSDEVHAPLTLPGAAHRPFLALSGGAAETGLAVVSASKAWNVAGLKCALVVAGSERMEREYARVPQHVRYHTGHLGVLASIAAYRDGADWLAGLLRQLDANRRRLAGLLAEQLPGVRYEPPQAGYLAWLDCRALDLGDDPAEAFLERGRVALTPGPPFGEAGKGFARLNFGTSSGLLAEAVRRMALSAAATR